MEGSGKKRFSDKDIARILSRAEKLQSESQGDSETGYDLAEVQRIASELGLDPRYVQSAVDSLEDEDSGDAIQTRWLGAPPAYEIERAVPGTLDEDRWQSIVGEMNSAFRQSIEGQVNGPVRTWHWKHEFGSVHLTATSIHDTTRLRVVAHIDDGLTAGCVATVLAMVVGAATVFSVDALGFWLSLPLAAVLVMAIGFYYRATASNWYRRDRKKMSRLVNRLENIIQSDSHTATQAPIEIEQRLTLGQDG